MPWEVAHFHHGTLAARVVQPGDAAESEPCVLLIVRWRADATRGCSFCHSVRVSLFGTAFFSSFSGLAFFLPRAVVSTPVAPRIAAAESAASPPAGTDSILSSTSK